MSLLSRPLGYLGRAGVVAAGTVAVATLLVGVDKQKGLARAAERRHPGPYTDEERCAAVRSYLDAITTPAAAFDVPFSSDCVRVENGLKTGFNGLQMRWDLHLHLQYATIARLENIVLTADPDGKADIVHAEFDITTLVGFTVHVSEDFTVPASDGLIHRIEARISAR